MHGSAKRGRASCPGSREVSSALSLVILLLTLHRIYHVVYLRVAESKTKNSQTTFLFPGGGRWLYVLKPSLKYRYKYSTFSRNKCCAFLIFYKQIVQKSCPIGLLFILTGDKSTTLYTHGRFWLVSVGYVPYIIFCKQGARLGFVDTSQHAILPNVVVQHFPHRASLSLEVYICHTWCVLRTTHGQDIMFV